MQPKSLNNVVAACVDALNRASDSNGKRYRVPIRNEHDVGARKVAFGHNEKYSGDARSWPNPGGSLLLLR
jgi:hypothetical protein